MINSLLKLKYNLKPEKEYLLKIFFSTTGSGRRFLLGRNELSENIMSVTAIDGIFDDFYKEKKWKGVPVFNDESLPGDAIIVNCSMSIFPVSAQKRIEQVSKNSLNYMDFCVSYANLVPPPLFVQEFRSDFDTYIDQWQDLYDAMADEESRETFKNVCSFRLTGDFSYMDSYTYNPKDQYFAEVVKLVEDEVFVDGGGFDGDTSEEFINRCPNYKKIFIFEPSVINLENAKKRLAPYSRIQFIEKAISDRKDILYFRSNQGSASKIEEIGESQIHADSIDNTINTAVTFIKMDLEGWEIPALNGCKKQIVNNKPKLAIAVYHRASDFRDIFNTVRQLNSNYKIYLRHYSEGWSETILYFIP